MAGDSKDPIIKPVLADLKGDDKPVRTYPPPPPVSNPPPDWLTHSTYLAGNPPRQPPPGYEPPVNHPDPQEAAVGSTDKPDENDRLLLFASALMIALAGALMLVPAP